MIPFVFSRGQDQLYEEEKKAAEIPPDEKGEFTIVIELRAAAHFWSAEQRPVPTHHVDLT